MDKQQLTPNIPGIRIEGLGKRYGKGDTAVDALKSVNMSVAPGEAVGLIGPSGSGKSTLLKCLGAIIEPSAGKMILGDTVIYDNGWKISDLRALRRDKIGFVFQAPYLIPFLSVTDNVALLPMLAGTGTAKRAGRQWNSSRRCRSNTGPPPCPRSFPAANSNGSPLPAAWSTGHRSFLPMNRRHPLTANVPWRSSES